MRQQIKEAIDDIKFKKIEALFQRRLVGEHHIHDEYDNIMFKILSIDFRRSKLGKDLFIIILNVDVNPESTISLSDEYGSEVVNLKTYFEIFSERTKISETWFGMEIKRYCKDTINDIAEVIAIYIDIRIEFTDEENN
jgi:hypothetical protein